MSGQTYESAQEIRTVAGVIAKCLGEKRPGYFGAPPTFHYRDKQFIIADAGDWLSIGFKPSRDFPGYIEVFNVGGLYATFNDHYPPSVWIPPLRALLDLSAYIAGISKGKQVWTIYAN